MEIIMIFWCTFKVFALFFCAVAAGIIAGNALDNVKNASKSKMDLSAACKRMENL